MSLVFVLFVLNSSALQMKASASVQYPKNPVPDILIPFFLRTHGNRVHNRCGPPLATLGSFILFNNDLFSTWKITCLSLHAIWLKQSVKVLCPP